MSVEHPHKNPLTKDEVTELFAERYRWAAIQDGVPLSDIQQLPFTVFREMYWDLLSYGPFPDEVIEIDRFLTSTSLLLSRQLNHPRAIDPNKTKLVKQSLRRLIFAAIGNYKMMDSFQAEYPYLAVLLDDIFSANGYSNIGKVVSDKGNSLQFQYSAIPIAVLFNKYMGEPPESISEEVKMIQKNYSELRSLLEPAS